MSSNYLGRTLYNYPFGFKEHTLPVQFRDQVELVACNKKRKEKKTKTPTEFSSRRLDQNHGGLVLYSVTLQSGTDIY